MTPFKEKQTFVELRAQGLPYAKIARKLGKSKQTLVSWAKDHEAEIANLRAIELESLREQAQLTKAARIRVLGKLLRKVEAEVGQRDLASVPTEKLVTLTLKLAEMVNAETSTMKFLGTTDILDQDPLMSERIDWTG